MARKSVRKIGNVSQEEIARQVCLSKKDIHHVTCLKIDDVIGMWIFFMNYKGNTRGLAPYSGFSSIKIKIPPKTYIKSYVI